MEIRESMKSIILTQQTVDPVIDNDFVALYTKNATSNISTTLQIFERIQQFNADIANTPIQLTYDQVNTAGPQYQSFLAGGYLIYFAICNWYDNVISYYNHDYYFVTGTNENTLSYRRCQFCDDCGND